MFISRNTRNSYCFVFIFKIYLHKHTDPFHKNNENYKEGCEVLFLETHTTITKTMCNFSKLNSCWKSFSSCILMDLRTNINMNTSTHTLLQTFKNIAGFKCMRFGLWECRNCCTWVIFGRQIVPKENFQNLSGTFSQIGFLVVQYSKWSHLRISRY